MINDDGINNAKYNEASEKAELMRELTDIEPMIVENFGNDSALNITVSDALSFGELYDLRMAKAALDSLPEHLKETLKSEWRPLMRRPEFKEVLTDTILKGNIRRFLKIGNYWKDNINLEEMKGKIVFELLLTDSPVTVYVKEGTSKEEALDFLKKAATELEDSWHLVSDSDQYQGYMD